MLISTSASLLNSAQVYRPQPSLLEDTSEPLDEPARDYTVSGMQTVADLIYLFSRAKYDQYFFKTIRETK